MEIESQEAQTTEGSTQPEQTGDIVQPDTLYANKYKSVSELEKGYNNLQSKLGNFTGAPEAYEPAEGVELGDDNAYFSKLQELGKELGLNNDGFNKIVQAYNESIEAEEASYEAQLKEEFTKLGDNAEARVRNINDWSKANLTESEQALVDSVSTSAEAVMLIEKFIGMSKPQGIAQDHQVETRPSYDADKLHAMRYAKDENGNRKMSVDAEYRQKVLDLEAQYL